MSAKNDLDLKGEIKDQRTPSHKTERSPSIEITTPNPRQYNQIVDSPARINEFSEKPQKKLSPDAIRTGIRAECKGVSTQQRAYAWKRIPEWDPYGEWTMYSLSNEKSKDESITRDHANKKE